MSAHLIKIGHLQSKIYRFHFTSVWAPRSVRPNGIDYSPLKQTAPRCYRRLWLFYSSDPCERAAAADVSASVWAGTDFEVLYQTRESSSLYRYHRFFVITITSHCSLGCSLFFFIRLAGRHERSSLAPRFVLIMTR